MMKKLTICMNCKYCSSFTGYEKYSTFCYAPKVLDNGINYITGKEEVYPRLCKNINTKGKCPFYVEKEKNKNATY